MSNKEEWTMLMDIQKYFGTDIMRVDSRDWDEVEDVVKKVIKPSAK